MRGLIASLVAGSLAVLSLAQARAQDWPAKQITIVVPFGAGGSADLLARILATHMQSKLGQSVIVENRGGAGGSIGTGYVAKAAPDGYTLLLGTVSSIAVNAALYPKLPFDVDKDLQPVTQLVSFPNLLIVNPKLPVKNVQELIDYLKKNEGKVNYASSGVGTSGHLSVVMFEQAIGTHMTHVPYKGAAPALIDMLSNQCQVFFDNLPSSIEHIRGGKLRALAVTTDVRSPALPDIPTAKEQGLDFDVLTWQGLFLAKDTPAPIVNQLSQAMSKALDLPSVRGRFETLGEEIPAPDRRTPEYFKQFVAGEIARWNGPIKASGVTVE